MEFVLVFIVILQIASARVKTTDCDFYVQNCVFCLTDGECYCRSSEEFTTMNCSKRNGERKGCFEIFDPEKRNFSCKLQTMYVKKYQGGVQLCKTFSKAEDLLNIHAARDDAGFEVQNQFEQLANLSKLQVLLREKDRSIATATLGLVVALVALLVVLIISIALGMMVLLNRKNGKPEKANEPPVEPQTQAPNGVVGNEEEEDAIYHYVQSRNSSIRQSTRRSGYRPGAPQGI